MSEKMDLWKLIEEG